MKNYFPEEIKVDIWRCSETEPPDIRPFSSEGLLFQQSQEQLSVLKKYSSGKLLFTSLKPTGDLITVSE